MLKIVMTIVTIVAGHITDRAMVEVPQSLWIQGVAANRLTCATYASMAADAYIARKLGASDADIAHSASNYIYDARKAGKPIMDLEYYSCNVPANMRITVRSVGHLSFPHVLNGANGSMG